MRTPYFTMHRGRDSEMTDADHNSTATATAHEVLTILR